MPPIARRRLLLFFASAAVGCQRSARKPSELRVISLSPSTTETVYALGSELVGRSRFCDFPEAVKRVPSVGGFVDPSLEAILGLGPTLVVGVQGPGGPDLVERLRAREIVTYFPDTDRMAQIDEMIVGLGERLERAVEARRLVQRIGEHRTRIARSLAKQKRPRALLVFGLRPIVAAGVGGFPHEMLTLAGADNVVDTPGARYPTLGIERVLALDPDVVVDATGVEGHDAESVRATLPGWKELRAIREGKLVTIRDARVLRPGPRIAEGLEVLARALHPKLELSR